MASKIKKEFTKEVTFHLDLLIRNDSLGTLMGEKIE